MKALREAVANGYPAEVTCKDAPKGDAHGQSNGEAERAVQTIQGMVRTLVSHIEEKTGQPLGNTSPVIAWAVEHAATLHLLFSKDTELKDGLTPFQRIKGRAWHIPLPCFGEIVEFRKRTETKSEPRWESGIYLGTRITSSEKIIGTAQGTFVFQSLKRKPPSSQWDMDFLKEFKSLPWSLKPEGPTSIPAPADIAPELPDAVVQGPVRPAPKEEAGRRMYLRKTDFDQFGFTAGCSACDELREGRSRAGILHSDHCRDRITSRLKDTPAGKDRLEANLERENKYLARYIEREDTASKASASSRALPSTLEQGTPLPSAPVSHSPMPMTPTMEVEQPVDPEDKKRPLYEPASTMRQKVARASPTTSGIPAPSSRKRVAQDQGDEDRIRVLESDTRAEAQKRPLEPGGDLDQLLAQGEDLVDGALAAHRSAVLANLIAEQPHRPLADIKDEFEPWFLEQSFYDDNTGKPLPSKGVMEARYEELQVIKQMGVWEVIIRPRNERTIGTRWIDINKGDNLRPKLRSRIVAQELRRKPSHTGMPESHWADFFAAMPPLSAMKALLALATTARVPDMAGKLQPMPKDRVLMFLDIKKAHFWAPARRRILVELPDELGLSKDYVGLLHRSLYGTRDAPLNWEMAIRDVMVQLGFQQGRSSPCLYYHPQRRILCSVHGDDFMVLTGHKDAIWLRDHLAEAWTVETRGILASPDSNLPDCVQQLSVLNRLITWSDTGIELEADPRHVELIVTDLGLKGSVPVTTPLLKAKASEEVDETPLSDQDASRYRSIAMRIGYLASDRPDLLRSTRELAKGLQHPTCHHWSLLKRIGRYLSGHGRLVQKFNNQDKITELTVWSDSDHAGCIRSRKSTSGTVIALGSSCIDARCKGQALIALSSAEAEFYGLISSASHGLGEQSMLKDWGICCPLVINMDATSGIAIGSRRGLGRVKHIDTSFFWIQDCVQEGKISLRKRSTQEMWADLMTKASEGPRIKQLLDLMSFEFKSGSHPLALRV